MNAFFESFFLRQDFFRGHQATYLSDVSRVLEYTGKIYSILDVLVMARDEMVMKEQIVGPKMHSKVSREPPSNIGKTLKCQSAIFFSPLTTESGCRRFRAS